jgi:hypothetical protein
MRALGHPLCVGLDPYLDRLPLAFRRGTMAPGQPDTAQAVEEFCCRAIDLIAADVAVVKPQMSLFERLGGNGWHALDASSGMPVPPACWCCLTPSGGTLPRPQPVTPRPTFRSMRPAVSTR